MRTGVANSPLHGGFCPPWLFEQMQRLGAAMVEVIVEEFSPEEVLVRLSDPVWFQAFGCVLGFDWHSSGLTTVVSGALKEGLKDRQADLGLFFAGGKGKASRRTPQEIVAAVDQHGLSVSAEDLQFASRMAAKVDNAALQDGFQLYHHLFVFTADGTWAVIQQGMNDETGYARRYHWLSKGLDDFVVEPHAAVCGERATNVLNMTADEAGPARNASTALIDDPHEVLRVLNEMREGKYVKQLTLPRAHPVPQASRLDKVLHRLYERRPADYAQLLGSEGVGPATVRALAMVAEVIYGTPPSRHDPVRYSFAHGGKDGHPKPVDREDYATSIHVLETALGRARIGQTDRLHALRRLARWQGNA